MFKNIKVHNINPVVKTTILETLLLCVSYGVISKVFFKEYQNYPSIFVPLGVEIDKSSLEHICLILWGIVIVLLVSNMGANKRECLINGIIELLVAIIVELVYFKFWVFAKWGFSYEIMYLDAVLKPCGILFGVNIMSAIINFKEAARFLNSPEQANME